ncbi:PspC family transcriptional regulator [Longispora fulva]|uniref:Phage shock protein PspC (Stress-responsive transcriptional regulator) n=1 Tax=Longispora fulva TaxID=619741 RepID=A0A8J7GGD0_9ACTN|nr:PspC domain-containing protein [Longispora fulva]MBG6140163.1 phage shock protein PspC (stress-responsive transcriptional regulator) [Longispora fulva]GIG57460.1 PspC family transcriptional regulator [Longispora fulva]
MTTPSHVPPPTADFRSRYSRPKEGRKLAGVCAALGRATNTDPVLWRVVFAVFALFGGAGLVAYAAGWLLLPEDGDSASPVEALLGRGQSSTSPLVTILVAIGAVTGAIAVADTNFEFAAILALIVVGVVLLVNKRPAGYPPPPVPFYMPAQATQTAPDAPTVPQAPPAGSVPFAPHGPYQQTGWTPPPPRPMQPPRPPKRPREKSILSRLTVFAALIAVGVLGILDASGRNVSVATYFGVALGVVGLGLVVGTFLGRGYKLIVLGFVLAFGLAVSASASEVRTSVVRDGGTRTWIPQSVGVIDPDYSIRVGLGTLDLRGVDFTDHTVTVSVSSSAGEMRVLLPATVDVEVHPVISNGEATVLDHHLDPDSDRSTITDLGADGTGGGKLIINLNVKFGTATVTR